MTEISTIRPFKKSFEKTTVIHNNLLSRIFQSVWRTFTFLPTLLSRYYGSKLQCEYQFGFKNILSQEEAASYLPYISAAAYGFTGNAEEFLLPLGWTPILPKDLNLIHSELTPTPYCYFDKSTGLKISFAEKENEILIAIPGLLFSAGSEKNEKARDYFNGIKRDPAKLINLSGGVPYVYLQAEQAINSLLELDRFKGKKITLVGQCFGGSIASYVALKKGLKAICFNSLQLGAGLQALIGDESLKKAEDYITHLCVQGDWLTTFRSIERIDRVLTYLHIRTPGNFGSKYLIPSAYSSSLKSHGFVLGSLMAYLGHDKRTTPKNLQQKSLIQLN